MNNDTKIANNPNYKFWARLFLYTILGILVLIWDPFGLSSKSNQASQDVIYRFFSNFYEPGVRDKIIVVLIDDHTIDSLYNEFEFIGANEWPLLYKDHAKILELIANYQPRAVFVDVYFKKERSTDNTLGRLLKSLQTATEKNGTQWFFAGGSKNEHLSDIQKKLGSVGTLSVNAWEGYGEAYPLYDKSKSTAAYHLYQLACTQNNPWQSCHREKINQPENKALSVIWGNTPAKLVFPSLRKDDISQSKEGICYSDSREWFSVISDFFSGLINGFDNKYTNNRVLCAYHPTIFAQNIVFIRQKNLILENKVQQGNTEESVLKEQEEFQHLNDRLATLLKDSIVLYGVTLEGFGDMVQSPVHGLLPGVMKHAMALDNLILYGKNYTKSADRKLHYISYVAWFFVVFFVSFSLWYVERKSQVKKRRRRRLFLSPKKKIAYVFKRLFFICKNILFAIRGIISSVNFVVYATSIVIIIMISATVFFVFNYEPLNIIAYFALSSVVYFMINNKMARKFLNLIKGNANDQS